MISKENQTTVFGAIAEITETKGSRKKMCSIFDIADTLAKKEIDAPKILIEACIDVLIQHKLIRYFRNDKGYMYFGITAFGWERWDIKTAVEEKNKVSVEQVALTAQVESTTPETAPETKSATKSATKQKSTAKPKAKTA